MPSINTILSVLSVIAASALTVSAAPVPVNVHTSINARDTPSDWATGYLESYSTYHLRYLALDCEDRHNTTFFEDCCHPLLADESLSSRPDKCTPTASEISSASSFLATATATDSAATSDYSSEATSVAAVISSEAASISATATASVSVVTVASTYVDNGSTTTAAATISVADNLVNGASSTSDSDSTWTSSSSAWGGQATASSTSTSAWGGQGSTQSSSTSSSDNWGGQQTSSSTSSSDYEASSTTSSAATSTTTASSSTSTNTGTATYFYQDGNAGACGNYNSDSAYIVAIDSAWWPNYETSTSDLCGKSLTITNTDNGNTAVATVADVCPTCDSAGSLDMSTGLFSDLAGSDWESEGTFSISWYFD